MNVIRFDIGVYSCEVINGVEVIVLLIVYVIVWCKCIDKGF